MKHLQFLTVSLLSAFFFFALPTLGQSPQTDEATRQINEENLEQERFMHDQILQDQMIAAMRTMNDGRANQPCPQEHAHPSAGYLAGWHLAVFSKALNQSMKPIIKVGGQLGVVTPWLVQSWDTWAHVLRTFAYQQQDEQIQKIELEEISSTLLKYAKKEIESRAEEDFKDAKIRSLNDAWCKENPNDFAGVIPCAYWNEHYANKNQ